MSTYPLLHVPIQRKHHVREAYQSRAHSRLQLTDQEQKAVKPVGDESLGLRALGPFVRKDASIATGTSKGTIGTFESGAIS